MKKNYTVRIGTYTNKKNVTKDWLFVELPGQDWGSVLLNADQCAAILAHSDKLRTFIAQQQQNTEPVKAKATPPPAPEPQPQAEDTTPDDATVELVQQINSNPALAAALATLAKSHTNIAGTASRNGNGKHSLARR
jgi:hypothetical protein